jgi:hypothetical protein
MLDRMLWTRARRRFLLQPPTFPVMTAGSSVCSAWLADIRGMVTDRLVEARGDAISALVAGLEHGDPHVRIGCPEALDKVGREDRDQSVQTIVSSDNWFSLSATSSLPDETT